MANMLPFGPANSGDVAAEVSVIDTRRNTVLTQIRVGQQPDGVTLAPNNLFGYVSNQYSNTVSVIDTATDTVVKTITNVGPEPRGLAITNDGDGDDHHDDPPVPRRRRQERRRGAECRFRRQAVE